MIDPFPLRKSLSRRAFVSSASLSVMATILGVNQGRAQAGAVVDLRAQTGSARLRGPQQVATPITGYGGSVPGPTMRVRRGQEITARLTNASSEPTTIHWHGLRVPNAMDGTPFLTQPPVSPGESFDYRFIAKDAGTFWYHAPLVTQLARGLYGPVIVDEPEPVDVDRDVLLVLDDWNLDPDGSLRDVGGPAASPSEPPLFTANGQRDLAIAARRGERVRLRLINATVNRLLPVALQNLTCWVVAIDGQPAEPFVARDSRVMLAPGNRIDLFVDIAEGVGTTVPIMVDSGGGQSVQIARFAIEDGKPLNRLRDAPKPLPQNPVPSRIDLRNAHRAQLALDAAPSSDTPSEGKKIPKPKAKNSGASVSWAPMDQLSGTLGPPLFSVRRDRPVTLTFANPGDQAQVIHVHGHTFRLLDNMDDGWKPFWLDTLLVAPQQTARIAFVADLPGKWAIERRSLSAPARESLTWFEVT